ncbi:rifin PIR protein, putative [Plasmodium reichenowi]|uniref:Rifin PIR protein, putative n=1 Tax=Plasmodium reichenowi TaxID=5854 RepID=A0A2P9D3Z3_PLARE|nr:rifin PIR protein, putative [Plasmodium reichenowi]
MKVHYINILLFALPLNILINDQRNHYITTHTRTNRSLCECDLYMPNYDNDLEMKRVMQQFEDRTSQRFQEYEEKMKTTRQKCKDQCDKEIQNIILKDKLEKQMEQQLTTLETKITTDDIPTCICEKSVADKVEKGCLRYGGILGSAMPELGAIGGTVVYAAAQSAAMKIFISKTIVELKVIPHMIKLFGDETIAQFVTPAVFGKPMSLYTTILSAKEKVCACSGMDKNLWCNSKEIAFLQSLPRRIGNAVQEGVYASNDAWVTATTPTTFFTNPLILSAIAILVIVLIMIIIYLILRYRRKKKMKKKLQYIKLLKE